MASERDPQTKQKAEAQVSAGPELRLIDRRAFVGFPPLPVTPGLSITDFALQIPEVSFPFSFTGGASKYQKKKLAFGFLEVTVDAELVARRVAQLAGRISELDELKLHFRPGYLEGQARFTSGDRSPITFKLAFDADGERLAVYVYDVRLYGFSTTPAAQVAVLLSRAVKDLELLPEVDLRGASGFSTRILPSLVELAAVGRGYKMPSLDQARLSAAEVSSAGLKLRFAAGGLPPASPPDEELMLALEGARAFAEAEELLAQGRLAEAREAYLKHGDVTEAHPFAIERLLTLLVADPQAHELALDVAATLARRRERSATAQWAEAVVRERRGESARAAERYLALCAMARRAQEEASAFFAAESAARSARDQAPQMAVRALHEVLGLKPDHLPSLKALARAADQANDRAGAIRAWRRIAALARDPSEAADAHVHMARLCALTEDDVAGARLHCEAALKLSPNHPEALYQLAELCHRAGEHLRAIKSLDRLREVALGRHEVDRIGRANVLAGKVWEQGLGQPENALLRYREATSLLPGDPEPLFLAARVAEKLGKLQEAVAGYQQAIELAGPAPRDEAIRAIAHQSHHAMARLYRTRLSEPARAREHLEAAFALDPKDLAAIEELLPYFRAAGKTAELADALEKAALVIESPERRAALWAEAAELYRGRLARPDRAEQLHAAALEADPHNRVALEGTLALAEAHRDGAQLCRCLQALAELEQDPKTKLGHLRRLAVAARDLAFDLDLAARALEGVLAVEADDLSALGELCALQRRRADMNGLVTALERRARVAEAHGDKRLAAAALRELAQVLEARLGRVAEALVALEKAARLSPDPALLFELAELSLRCDRPQNARLALEELLAALPSNAAPERIAEVRARLGRACEQLGDRDAAKEHYAQAFPLRRMDDELAGRLEALYRESGETLALAELWAARAQAFVAHDRGEDAAPLFLKSARVLLQSGERGTAVLRLNAALEAAPQGPLAGEILEATAELELERGARREAARLYARRAALIDDPRGAARTFFRAAELSRGQPREEEYLAAALEREPRFAPARIRRAELVLETNPRAALEDLEAVLALPVEDVDAPGDEQKLQLTRRAAGAAARAGRSDTARRLLGGYVARRPDDLEAQKELAALHRKAGAREALADQLSELWPLLPVAEQRPVLREYAELCLDLGRPAAATEALRALLQLEPENLWAAGQLLRLLPPNAQDDERLALLSLLIQPAQGDERAELLLRRAKLHRAARRVDEARTDLRAAAAAASHPAEALRQLAELARESNDLRAELEVWRAAPADEPGLREFAASRALAIGQAALEQGQHALAAEAFTVALAQPLSADDRCAAAMGLADAALEQGNPGQAAAALLEASKQGPAAQRLQAHLRRGALLEATAPADAAVAWEAALELSPHHPEATLGLKRALTALGRWDDLAALLHAEAAQAEGARAAALHAELGALYLEKLGNDAAAEAAFEKAAALDPGHADARRTLVELLAKRGAFVQAAQHAEALAGLSSPGDGARVLRTLGLAAHRADAGELALELLRRAHALEPEADDEATEALVARLHEGGHFREAVPLARRLAEAADLAEGGDRAEALQLRLAELAERAGDVELSEAALRRLVRHRPASESAARRLSALLAPKSPRESIEVLWGWARSVEEPGRALPVLEELARRARAELADVELTAAILRRAAEISATPLEAHRALVALHRETGRTQELMHELLQVAELSLAAGDDEGAIAAWEEEAALAEQSGRVDEALRTLQGLRELCEDEGDLARAASYERRRAELLRDARLDLDAAEAALQKAFELSPSLEVARQGEQLARRRDDAAAEADWIERSIDLYDDLAERSRAFLALAKLFDGPLAAPAQAEAAARQALAIDPSLEEAEALLVRSLERDGRLAELAQHLEERAAHTADPKERARLFLEAAHVYKDRAGRPDDAAAAILAARASQPDDLELTARCADLLHEAGRPSDAAEFDALLLEEDPFRERVFERHQRHLAGARQWPELAALLLRRAEAEEALGEEGAAAAAGRYLAAADAFRKAGAQQQALLCEDRAFDASAANDRAFEAVRARATDVRRLSAILRERAHAVPAERVQRLKERAEVLLDAGEELLAAEAFDELLSAAGEDVEAIAARAELAAKAGGPLAAQPYDRRLLAAGGDRLPVPVRLKAQLRLGHAALGAGALKDAADAFDAVVALDPDGEKGREALSLLAEVHARTQNTAGLFQTSLLLAERAKGEEAEALYRRAAELFDDPAEAIDALVPLARLRPSDPRVIERAAAGLKKLGRAGEAVDLLERGAQSLGGAQAAAWLLEAAQIAEAELSDEAKAHALRERAGELDPANAAALRALADGQRRRGDPALIDTLAHLAAALEPGDAQAQVRLERARLLLDAGQPNEARADLEAVAARGPGGDGYVQALEGLCEVLAGGDEPAALAEVLEKRAALADGEARAALLLEGARAFERADDLQRALRLCREATATRPSLVALQLLATLHERRGEADRAARALLDAAELASEDARAGLRLKAVEVLEAAGEKDEAAETLEQLAEAHPDLLPPQALADRFLALGDKARALKAGFAVALEEGRLEDALRLADRAGDEASATRALWALVQKDADETHVQRLAEKLESAGAHAERLRLAQACEAAGANVLAAALFEELIDCEDPEVAAAALRRCLEVRGEDGVRWALGRIDETSAPELIDVVLSRAREAAAAGDFSALEQAAAAWPHRSAALWREVFERRRDAGQAEEAARALEALLEVEDDLPARSALHVELGELYLHALDRKDLARDAFELALTEDLHNVAAVRHLVDLLAEGDDHLRFVAMTERLTRLVGPAASAGYRERLADAYEALGRTADAYRLLAELPETTERIHRRAALAESLGLGGEALQLREKVTTDRPALEGILVGYARAQLVPFAVRLGERLMAEGPLAHGVAREVAERLSPASDGAAFAVTLWPELLRQTPTDADGWTLFGEALGQLGREDARRLVDGFGAALTGSRAPAPAAPLSRLDRSKQSFPERAAPAGACAITATSMPRLFATLSGALETLGAGGMRLWLHPSGGVEAWLLSEDELVLGAGALGAFGPVELTWLCALALALGPDGHRLAEVRPPREGAGVGEALVTAAVTAFDAHPASLAACRVLALLDDEARGGDPEAVDIGAILRRSAAFRAVAACALDLV
ncbi:MAG: tetratricopeptide repeat protein [Myxococcaceae bacterium]|nr:tetratricopeptide repeat protein [Myxococcaceae bacterium]